MLPDWRDVFFRCYYVAVNVVVFFGGYILLVFIVMALPSYLLAPGLAWAAGVVIGTLLGVAVTRSLSISFGGENSSLAGIISEDGARMMGLSYVWPVLVIINAVQGLRAR